MKTLISLKPADNAGFSYCSIILITVVDDQLGIDAVESGVTAFLQTDIQSGTVSVIK